MKSKVKVFVASLEINDQYVGTDEICKYCTPSHVTETVAQQLEHSQGSILLLPDAQREIVDMAREFCREYNFEIEVVDIANLNFFEKMKLAFRGIRAPSISFEDKVIKGKLTKERLKALTLNTPRTI